MATESNPGSLLIGAPKSAGLATVLAFLPHWWAAFAASSILVVCGHLLIKAGLNSANLHIASATLGGRILHILIQPEVIEGLLIYLLGTLCWMAAVAQKEISFLYPLTSVNYVLVVATSVLFFHETVSLRRAAGVAVIVFGIFLMNRKSGKGVA